MVYYNEKNTNLAKTVAFKLIRSAQFLYSFKFAKQREWIENC